MMQQLFRGAKTLHRWVMWAVLGLGGWMMTSGFLMHEELEGKRWLGRAAMRFVREWHNTISTWFLVVLATQMLTGVAMWGIPKILAYQRNRQKPTPEV